MKKKNNIGKEMTVIEFILRIMITLIFFVIVMYTAVYYKPLNELLNKSEFSVLVFLIVVTAVFAIAITPIIMYFITKKNTGL